MDREIVMLLNELGRFAAWVRRWLGKVPTTGAAPAAVTISTFDFDPMWHGDHWQNLLSSPMDARHYVMEDWAAVVDPDFAPAGLASQVR
jgi:hypothetical protein